MAAPGANDHLSAAQAAAQITRSHEKWSGSPTTVTFGFLDNNGSVYEFDPQQMATTQEALALWSDVANIRFSYAEGDPYVGRGIASINFINYFNDKSPNEYAGTSATFSQGYVDVGFNFAANGNTFGTNLGQGEYDRKSLIHEIGHAIGLDHPGDYNASNGIAIYENDRGYVEDSAQYSIMSYFSEGKTGADFQGVYASTPLLHDIAAAQLLYGANTETRKGATTYGFNSNADREAFHIDSASEKVVFAIWDADGEDTLDFSGYRVEQTIELTAEKFSSVGGLKGNVAIAAGAVIENAIGGSSIDHIYGNAVGNVLTGNAGNDDLRGGEGRDVLRGGADSDTLDGGKDGIADVLEGGSGDDTYIIHEKETVLEDPNAPTDTVSSGVDTVRTDLAKYTLDANVENLVYIGDTALVAGGPFEGRGNTLDNTIIGGRSADRLYGGDGKDRLDGGKGGDTMDGGNGNDTYIVDNAQDKVVEVQGVLLTDRSTGLKYWSGGTDTIETTLGSLSLEKLAYVENLTFKGAGPFTGIGNDLNNRLTGGSGVDTLRGGRGDDTYVVDSDADRTIEAKTVLDAKGNIWSGGIDTVETTAGTYHLQANVENLVNINMDVKANFAGVGNELANVVTGSVGHDVLDGGLGNDTLTGGLGRNTFVFGKGWGADTVTDFVTGVDTLDVRNVDGLTSFDQFTRSTSAAGTLLTFGTSDSIFLKDVGGGGVDASDFLFAGALAGPIVGTSGADSLVGTDASDTLIGLGGADRLDGGEGIDTVSYAASAVGVWANLGSGKGNYGDAEGDTYVSIERVIGSAFDDQLSDVLGNFNGYLEGGGGKDVLAGREGADKLLGGAGDDLIYATDGDTIDGGADYDTVIAEDSTAALGFHFKMAGTNVEYALGNAGNDVIDATGVATKVTISGMNGNNTLTGGSAGDRIDAGSGNDLIVGAGGDDLVTGGAGADTFGFKAAWGHDTITDFQRGVDKIDISVTGLTSYSQLAITDTAQGAQVAFGSDTIVFQNLTAAQLTQDNFVFHG